MCVNNTSDTRWFQKCEEHCSATLPGSTGSATVGQSSDQESRLDVCLEDPAECCLKH